MPYASPDPFDDPFEEGHSDAPFASHGEAGAPDDPAAEARREALALALATGSTGVPFEVLLRLALPLVALYGLDASDVRSVVEQPDSADPDAVALLEATRLLWAFLSLPEGDQAGAVGPLLEHLGGGEPDASGWEVVHELIETTQPAWDAIGGKDGAAELAPRALPFEALLEHSAFTDLPHTADSGTGGYGQAGLSEVEARALFAQPLLDDPEVLADPDAFEAALARADAYWEIATHPERVKALAAFVRRESGSSDERSRLSEEGSTMLDRFDSLFPERTAAE